MAHGENVFTPPLASGCLPGVTRALLLDEVHVPGVRVTERVLFPNDLEAADEVFISSTTRELWRRPRRSSTRSRTPTGAR